MSRSRFAKSAAIIAIVSTLQPLTANAQDASFPCKVLLCTLATNPSWPAIPYCVPIMQHAFALQALGIAVGVCAEAMQGAGAGYQSSPGLPQSLNDLPKPAVPSDAGGALHN